MGHGTTVPGEFDIDLVIYSRDISGREVLRSASLFQPWLRKLHAFLQNKRGYSFKKMTKRSVQFRYKDKVDVDLLVSPYWSNKDEFYMFLRDEVPRDQRDDFTVCASKWQVEFFKPKPNEVKEFSRRAKKWRNETWPKDSFYGGEGRPSSYLMSLLVVLAYHEATPTKKAHDVTRALKEIVKKGQSLGYYWGDDVDRFPSLVPRKPYIIDPANPANNVWYSGFKGYLRGEKPNDYEPGDGNSTVLKRHIDSIDLSKPV